MSEQTDQTQQQLSAVQAAIEAIESGAAETYSLPTKKGSYREYSYENLETLYELETRLKIKLAKETS